MRLGLFLLPSLLVLGSCALPINSATSSSSKGGSDVAISNSEVITSEPFEYGENYIATHLGNEYEITYSYSTKSNGVVAEPLLITSAHNASGYYIKDNADTEALFLKDGTTYVVYMLGPPFLGEVTDDCGSSYTDSHRIFRHDERRIVAIHQEGDGFTHLGVFA